jgi:26S proteasome regulatory subunit N2
MIVRPQSSAVGVLALLSEPEPLLKQHALKSLIPLVSQFWAEISEHISLMYVHKSSICTVLDLAHHL